MFLGLRSSSLFSSEVKRQHRGDSYNFGILCHFQAYRFLAVPWGAVWLETVSRAWRNRSRGWGKTLFTLLLSPCISQVWCSCFLSLYLLIYGVLNIGILGLLNREDEVVISCRSTLWWALRIWVILRERYSLEFRARDPTVWSKGSIVGCCVSVAREASDFFVQIMDINVLHSSHPQVLICYNAWYDDIANQGFLWCFLGSDNVRRFSSSFTRRLGVRRFESDVMVVCSTYSNGFDGSAPSLFIWACPIFSSNVDRETSGMVIVTSCTGFVSLQNI